MLRVWLGGRPACSPRVLLGPAGLGSHGSYGYSAAGHRARATSALAKPGKAAFNLTPPSPTRQTAPFSTTSPTLPRQLIRYLRAELPAPSGPAWSGLMSRKLKLALASGERSPKAVFEMARERVGKGHPASSRLLARDTRLSWTYADLKLRLLTSTLFACTVSPPFHRLLLDASIPSLNRPAAFDAFADRPDLPLHTYPST